MDTHPMIPSPLTHWPEQIDMHPAAEVAAALQRLALAERNDFHRMMPGGGGSLTQQDQQELELANTELASLLDGALGWLIFKI